MFHSNKDKQGSSFHHYLISAVVGHRPVVAVDNRQDLGADFHYIEAGLDNTPVLLHMVD